VSKEIYFLSRRNFQNTATNRCLLWRKLYRSGNGRNRSNREAAEEELTIRKKNQQ